MTRNYKNEFNDQSFRFHKARQLLNQVSTDSTVASVENQTIALIKATKVPERLACDEVFNKTNFMLKLAGIFTQKQSVFIEGDWLKLLGFKEVKFNGGVAYDRDELTLYETNGTWAIGENSPYDNHGNQYINTLYELNEIYYGKHNKDLL